MTRFKGLPPRPQQPKPVEPAPETVLRVADEPIVGDYVDDDDAPVIAVITRPVPPGDRPAPTVLTPEIEARALGPKPEVRWSVRLMNATPRRPTLPPEREAQFQAERVRKLGEAEAKRLATQAGPYERD